jgi:DNA repair exonuclease SbcCD ATPase subunit
MSQFYWDSVISQMRVVIESFRCHDNIDMDLSSFVLIRGKTGSGKTSILDAIEYAIFGSSISAQVTVTHDLFHLMRHSDNNTLEFYNVNSGDGEYFVSSKESLTEMFGTRQQFHLGCYPQPLIQDINNLALQKGKTLADVYLNRIGDLIQENNSKLLEVQHHLGEQNDRSETISKALDILIKIANINNSMLEPQVPVEDDDDHSSSSELQELQVLAKVTKSTNVDAKILKLQTSGSDPERLQHLLDYRDKLNNTDNLTKKQEQQIEDLRAQLTSITPSDNNEHDMSSLLLQRQDTITAIEDLEKDIQRLEARSENLRLIKEKLEEAIVIDTTETMLELVDHYCRQFQAPLRPMSQGEKSKLLLAQSLALNEIWNYPFLLLDEPLVGVEADMRRKILVLLSEYASSRHITILLCSHNEDQHADLFTQIIDLDK